MAACSLELEVQSWSLAASSPVLATAAHPPVEAMVTEQPGVGRAYNIQPKASLAGREDGFPTGDPKCYISAKRNM